MKPTTLFLVLAALPTLAHAHGDHGHSFLEGLEHLLSSPEHFWPLLVAMGVVGYVARRPVTRILNRLRNRD